MTSAAITALKNADLATALAELQNEARRDPAQPKHRIFLFQLLSLLGQWDRALTQLNVVRDLDPGALEMVQTYQEALRCEALRARVMAGERSPLFFGEPEEWMAQLWQAHKFETAGHAEEAQTLREQAFEQAPTPPGTIWRHSAAGSARAADQAPPGTPPADIPYGPGEKFEWLGDADARFAPVLEAIINGRYYWIPLHRIRRVDFEKPTDLRDFVWLPAHFEWVNGGEVVGLVPSRYPGSETHRDDLIRLGRKTEWAELRPNLFAGLGQRMLATDADEYPLFDVRRIIWDETASTE